MFEDDFRESRHYMSHTPFELWLARFNVQIILAVVVLFWVILCVGYSYAADLPHKALKAAPVPVIQTYSFYVGAFGGAGLTKGVNEFSAFTLDGPVPITQVSTGVVRGFPTSPFAGATMGFTQTFGTFLIDFAADGAYVFSRGCITQDCTTARKDGWLMEQGVGVGLSLASLNALQPIPLSSPAGVPPSVWSSLILMARGGAEERTLDLCQFAVTDMAEGQFTGSTVCGSKIIAAPFAGAELAVKSTPQTEFFFKWSHVFWGKQYQLGIDTTAVAAAAGSTSFQRIDQEDIFRVGFKYYLF